MRLRVIPVLVFVLSGAASIAVRADARSEEKSLVKFEGALGRLMNFVGGKAAKEGIVSTVAVKGDRKGTLNDSAGRLSTCRTESGQARTINGFNTREVVMTVVAREKGKTLEQGGAMVMTTNTWLAPKVAALDDAAEFGGDVSDAAGRDGPNAEGERQPRRHARPDRPEGRSSEEPGTGERNE
jgi:hypothetical protein